MNQRARTDLWLLAGFAAFLFFFGLNSFGLIGADEPRYAQVAREMLERRDWITPTLGGKPWLEKPPLYYWQASLAYGIFGVRDWIARLPSAMDATFMVVAIYLFLRRFRPGFQLDGALMTAGSAAIIGYARAASTDMPLAAAFTIALLGWYAWYESQTKSYLAVFYIFIGMGMLAKGPVAPVLAALVIVLFVAAQRDLHLALRTLWLPGVALFCLVAFPWYVAVQLRNPDFSRIFVLQHNLERFGSNLYHHTQPFWYYLPVMLLALLPWTTFVIADAVETVQAWWGEGRSFSQSRDAWNAFLLLWLAVPAVFFSFSQSKLPGYILPAVPAGALLLTEYVTRHVADNDPPPRWLIALHAIISTLPLVAALMIRDSLITHRILWTKTAFLGLSIAVVLAVGIALTLAGRLGLRGLRFVTMVPVVLVIAALIRIDGPALDAVLSARPVALEMSRMETKPLPLAAFGVSRETEYGLAFYRNQPVHRYEWGFIPAGEHLLLTHGVSQAAITAMAPDRRVSLLGDFAPQDLHYYWVSAPGLSHGPMHH